MPRTARPTPETLQLRVTSPPSASERTQRLAATPLLPWPLAAGLGGVVAALLGWLLAVGVVGVAWVTAAAIPLADVLAFCSRWWLLAHGGSARIDDITITLVPLGLTLAAAVLAGGTGRFAGVQARLARPAERRPSERLRLAVQVAGLTALGYAGIAAAMALALDGPGAAWLPAASAFGIALAGALAGALHGLGLGAKDLRQRWLAATVQGGLGGGLGLLAVGAIVVGLATWLGADRVAAVEESLGLDPSGRFVWSVLVLAYLPTVLVWGACWALGGGITIGTGSLVTLWGTKLGMLPAIPLFGALPPTGLAPPQTVGWLASGMIAGALAGAIGVHRLGPVTRTFRSAAIAAAVAAGAGVIASVLLLAAAWAGAGSLGGLRLAAIGPLLPELLVAGPPTLVLAAVVGGMLWWTVGAVRARGGPSVG